MKMGKFLPIKGYSQTTVYETTYGALQRFLEYRANVRSLKTQWSHTQQQKKQHVNKPER